MKTYQSKWMGVKDGCNRRLEVTTRSDILYLFSQGNFLCIETSHPSTIYCFFVSDNNVTSVFSTVYSAFWWWKHLLCSLLVYQLNQGLHLLQTPTQWLHLKLTSWYALNSLFFHQTWVHKHFLLTVCHIFLFNVSLINLFNVAGDKYGFLSVPVGLSFVQSISKVRFLHVITRTIKNKFKTI